MNKFKVGDKVVRTKDNNGYLPVGTICEISSVSLGTVMVKGLEGFSSSSNFELVSEEPETVTYKGNVYQIGKHYLFGSYRQMHKLLSIDSSSMHPFRVIIDEEGVEDGYSRISLVNVEAGTITPVPVELVDGGAYSFTVRSNSKCRVGIYQSSRHIFNISQGQWFDFEEVTNIRLMTVGVNEDEQ